MSSISVFWNTVNDPPVSTAHAAMLSALESYGPDGQFAWSDQRIALGVKVFSSLPEDQFDQQPVWSPDGSACLVGDVRLDNRADLARELGLTQPERLPDSFYLMAAWLRWGPACLHRLIGAFAFAVWTPGAGEIFAARDHTGERPLFFHRTDRQFALASMPKALLALPNFDASVRELYTAEWLACASLDWTQTFYKNVQRVPPGHCLHVTVQNLQMRQYWHPTHAKPVRFRRDEDYAESLLEIFDRATEARLRSSKGIGSFLSSGLDSTSVTASAATLLARNGKGLVAFTSVPRPEFNGAERNGYFAHEAAGAAELASRYPNVEHVMLDSRGYDLLPTMKKWIDALDEPAPSVINMLWLSAIFDNARQRGIGVMLEGASGNGTFSYNNWGVLAWLLRRGQCIGCARTAYALHNRGVLRLTSAARIGAGSLIPRWVTRKRASAESLENLFACLANPQWMEKYSLQKRIFDAFYPAPAGFVAEHSSLFDGFEQGPHRAAVQAVTRVELRDPTADRRLYEFCFGIPPQQYVAGGQSRSLARRAMKDRLPESVLTRQNRGLQAADWYIILRESLPQLRSELNLIARSPSASQALDVDAIHALLDNWPQSEFHVEKVYARWNFWLARAFSMGYFLRRNDPVIHADAFAGIDNPRVIAAPLK